MSLYLDLCEISVVLFYEVGGQCFTVCLVIAFALLLSLLAITGGRVWHNGGSNHLKTDTQLVTHIS